MRKLAFTAIAMLLALPASGCSSDQSSAGPPASATTACDPLAAVTTSVSSVLAAGVDASGTMYVVDTTAAGQQRIFVTSGGQLVRVPNVGSGQSGTTQYIFTFTSPGSQTSGDMELFVDTSDGTTTMAVSPATGGKDFSPPSDATTLTVVDASSVEGKTAQDLPGEVGFVVDVGDGTTLVITEPAEAYGTAGFRLFLGTAPTLEERTITSYSQSGDGAVDVTFAGTGGSEGASIPCVASELCSMASPDGMLTGADGGTTTLTVRQPTPTTLAGLTLLCE